MYLSSGEIFQYQPLPPTWHAVTPEEADMVDARSIILARIAGAFIHRNVTSGAGVSSVTAASEGA